MCRTFTLIASYTSAFIISLALLYSTTIYAESSEVKSPLAVKVVVVTMFEIGDDEGDRAGEFQLWKAGKKLTSRYPLAHGHHDIFVNEETGVLGIVTGMGIAKATAAIMALGLDSRFDLRHAYWLVAGIAGIDPVDGTIGSAVWANYLVDGDLAHQIDAREMPSTWTTGYFPLFANEPYPKTDQPRLQSAPNGEVYQLHSPLVEWAYQLTKSIRLADTPAMQTLRAHYTDSPAALGKPQVMKGDQLAASTFWHGEKFNQWANNWTAYWTDGKGNFVTSAMEDTGSYLALSYLDNAGKADKRRMLVLRTVSNFTMQPPGLTAAENLQNESTGAGFAGLQPSVEAAYKVGSKVVDEILGNWTLYKTQLPEATPNN